MNTDPMRLRFSSGSSIPRSAAKKRSRASTSMTDMPRQLAKAAITSSPSPSLKSPLSTKTQVSPSPMAR
jgi:hypothetical protein